MERTRNFTAISLDLTAITTVIVEAVDKNKQCKEKNSSIPWAFIDKVYHRILRR
jgi:hypothetical protein